MEGRILKISSIFLTMTIIAASVILGHFTNIHIREIKRQQMSYLQMFASYTQQGKEVEEIGFDQQLRLEMPRGVPLKEVKIENDYIKQLITIQIPDAGGDYFDEHPLLGRSNHIADLHMDNGIIEMTMDSVYEVKCTLKKGYLYIDFLKPQEVYDKVIVIDAGHGGRSPGAIKQDIMEKDINLAIVKKLKDLLDKNNRNIGVYYNSLSDS